MFSACPLTWQQKTNLTVLSGSIKVKRFLVMMQFEEDFAFMFADSRMAATHQ